MREAMRDDVRLVYLANPNNPTGTWFEREALESFLAAMPDHVLVVVDEAYAEYFQHEAGWSAIDLLPRFANLVVTRTFSKAHALAGLRIGYLVADPGVCDVLERLRESFNVNVVAQAAACASLEDGQWLGDMLARNQAGARTSGRRPARTGPCLPAVAHQLCPGRLPWRCAAA